jgi:hypothetical protein
MISRVEICGLDSVKIRLIHTVGVHSEKKGENLCLTFVQLHFPDSAAYVGCIVGLVIA